MFEAVILPDNKTIGDQKIIYCDSPKTGMRTHTKGEMKRQKLMCQRLPRESNSLKYQWGIDVNWFLSKLLFFFPFQMLHVNILEDAILKFIKVHTYGTDPIHLKSTKFIGSVSYFQNTGVKKAKKKKSLLKVWFFISSTQGSALLEE